MERDFHELPLGFDTPVDAPLQRRLAQIDADLRTRHGLSAEQTAVGLLDLRAVRLATVRPDRMEYAASVAKVAILLAYFELEPGALSRLTPATRHELGLMIKSSSNEMATRFSRQLGLSRIQQALNSHGFYDRAHGGGIWMGKHYGENTERYGDPLADNSHAVTVRQLLRFYLLLEQGKLVSAQASAAMRDIFASPDIPHDPIKFVKGLSGRPREVRRKWGSWEDWLHDSAVIRAPDRHYILVGLTHHPRGDDYLVDLARLVDDEMKGAP